ncbi:unnamed protein product [Rotaria sp. Silwood2]|nr:unnamed protein product [Rotaria sp. Silwood2]CAF4559061.1 unnamed protein product [Rotaria sp. Silwood2]
MISRLCVYLLLLVSSQVSLNGASAAINDSSSNGNDTLILSPLASALIDKNDVDKAPTLAKAVINTNILTIFTYDDSRVYVYESKSNENAPSNKWLFFYLPVMSPVALPNHDRWVRAIGNEVRLRLMVGNEKVEELARKAILRKFSNSTQSESSEH